MDILCENPFPEAHIYTNTNAKTNTNTNANTNTVNTTISFTGGGELGDAAQEVVAGRCRVAHSHCQAGQPSHD